MATGFTTLSADDVCTSLASLLNVLGVANHIHIQDAICVEFLHDVLGSDPDSGDKELCAAGDDDVDKVVKTTFGVVKL